jgi:uncharacterized protein (DUF305 family)
MICAMKTALAQMAVLLCAIVPLASCSSSHTGTTSTEAAADVPVIVRPGAPGEPGKVVSAAEAADTSKVQFTNADVHFMQGMIHHHAQALDMTALVPDHSNRDTMKKLAFRIKLSQEDEIGMMQKWLAARGKEVPGVHAHHMAGATLMPGMLTAGEMDRLAKAKGEEFDRLFLEGMIRHHGGALTMVHDLLATPGAAQASDIFDFTAEILADQQAEIHRMGSMLEEHKK